MLGRIVFGCLCYLQAPTNSKLYNHKYEEKGNFSNKSGDRVNNNDR